VPRRSTPATSSIPAANVTTNRCGFLEFIFALPADV
jgi:hypothetical protein